MDKQKLDKITDYLTDAFSYNDLFYRPDNCYVPWLLDMVASLHNELYKEVTGEYYDYMHHWTNAVGYDNIDDSYFKLLTTCKNDEK